MKARRGGCASVLSENGGLLHKGITSINISTSRVSAAICIGESWHTNIRDGDAPILRRFAGRIVEKL